MKKMKKILSVLLTLAMVLGMSVTTFAAQTNDPSAPPAGGENSKYKPISISATGKETDRGTITIDGFYMVNEGTEETPNWKLPTNLTVEAYQIVKAVYANNETYKDGTSGKEGNNDGSFSKYEAVFGEDKVGRGNAITDELPNKPQVAEGTLPALFTPQESQLAAIWNYIEKVNKDENPNNNVLTAVDPITVGTTDSTVGIGANAIKTVEQDTVNGTFKIRIPNLPVGSYLIAVTNSETKIYNPIVASIYYNVDSSKTGNTMEQGNFSITSTPSWVKVTDNPGVKKDIVTETKDASGNVTGFVNENHGSANIGDTIKYQVVIDPIPGYSGEYPALKVEDTLSPGLQYNNDLEVKIYSAGTDLTIPANVNDTTKKIKLATLTANTDYTVTSTEEEIAGTDPVKKQTNITVNFVKETTTDGKTTYAYNLTEYAGAKAVITYSATLKADAAVNEGGNENGVKLSYTRDSRTDQNGKPKPENPIESKTYSYTFDIDGGVTGTGVTETITKGILEKVGEVWSETEEKYVSDSLANAKFTLYTKNPDDIRKDATLSDEQKETKLAANVYKQTINGGFTGIVSSNSEGQLPINGLAEGTYYLQETEAPSGYSLNAQVFEIKIEAEYYDEDGADITLPGGTTKVPQYKAGELKSWNITINGADLKENEAGTGTVENAFTVEHQSNSTTKVIKINGVAHNDPKYADAIKTVTIKNTRLATLPSTGGIGTTIFTFGGCAIMILAAALFFISRRKSAK